MLRCVGDDAWVVVTCDCVGVLRMDSGVARFTCGETRAIVERRGRVLAVSVCSKSSLLTHPGHARYELRVTGRQ